MNLQFNQSPSGLYLESKKMTTQHTPGPWRVAPTNLYAGDDINIDAHGHGYVAMCGKRGDIQAEIDAKLIAAAPELLEALQRILKAANLSTNDTATLDWVADTASAAIAKATGVNHD